MQQEENQNKLDVAVEHTQWMEEGNECTPRMEVAVEDAQWMEH